MGERMNPVFTAVPTRSQLRYAMKHPLARGTVIVAIAVTAVAVVIGVGFSWWPAHVARELQQTIDSAHQDAQQVKHRQALSAAYEQTRRALPVLERKLLQPVNQAGAIEALRALAKKSGLRIGNASYGRLPEEPGYSALSHELNVTGTYAAVKRFLAALPGLATYTTVLDMRVEPNGRGRVVKVTLRLATLGASTQASVRAGP